MTVTRCAVAGCRRPIMIPTMQISSGPFDPHEGICRRCARSVRRDQLQLFLCIRRELIAVQDLRRTVLTAQAWELVKMSAGERRGLRGTA